MSEVDYMKAFFEKAILENYTFDTCDILTESRETDLGGDDEQPLEVVDLG